jgi:hypothetical protein
MADTTEEFIFCFILNLEPEMFNILLQAGKVVGSIPDEVIGFFS